MLEFQSLKIFLLKDTFQIGQKKFSLLVKLKIQFLGLMSLVTWVVKRFLGSFYEKEFQKTNQENFRIEKIIRKKGDILYVKWKGYDSSFNSWINKKDIV